ncbi:hypothetical protein POM88_001326 [Heracleum sosnowskyi]|uniref:Small EDRK-rich factor-like N-terminal domain-containing protein n=1 Tax=Heracleum sosnowskyi TaxID=360622 RepID=A0AAD8JDG9_9APIA|nr:hypothetical protein POM88_001326 [Heracleum sosnowskyi]
MAREKNLEKAAKASKGSQLEANKKALSIQVSYLFKKLEVSDIVIFKPHQFFRKLVINKYLGQTTVPSNILMPIVKANGLAGILHVLLHFPLSEEDAEDVKGTLRYMMSNRFPHSGNYPSCEGNPRDKLVQWSHGAAGMAITLSKASKVCSPCVVSY